MKKNTSAEAQGTRTPVAMSCSRAHLAACRWKCAQSRPCDRTYLRPCLRRGAGGVLVFNFTPHAHTPSVLRKPGRYRTRAHVVACRSCRHRQPRDCAVDAYARNETDAAGSTPTNFACTLG